MNIYQTDHTKIPEIFNLIKAHKNDEVKKLIYLNPTLIHLKGWMDNTPLHIASSCGNFEIVKFLVEKGANINAMRSGVCVTPVCWANAYQIAEFLLDNGAFLIYDELLFATKDDKVEIVDLFLKRGAKIDSSRPEYIECLSIECIKVYLKHKIEITGSDIYGSTLLHKAVLHKLPDVFDYAYENGCPWQKDNSQRTPYNLAMYGAMKSFLKHIKEKYPELIAYTIQDIPAINSQYERIIFLKQSSLSPDCFIGLTESSKLIKYRLSSERIKVEKKVEINVCNIRNFTFNESGNLVIPTGENQLLILEQSTFDLIQIINLEQDLNLDQIEYLSSKGIYIGSHDWEIDLLSKDFEIIRKHDAQDGTIFPLVNKHENMIAFESYDQVEYFNLYQLTEDLSIEYIHTFFKNWSNSSSGFSFNNEEFAVSFPNEIEYYSVINGKLNKLWEIDISQYKSVNGLSYLTVLDENLISLGKGKTVLIISRDTKTVITEIELNLLAEIRGLYLYKEKKYLLIWTDKEIKALLLMENLAINKCENFTRIG